MAWEGGRNGARAEATAVGVREPSLPCARLSGSIPGTLLLGDGGWLTVRRSSGVHMAAPAAATMAAAADCRCSAASCR